jgi:hypothetical protein
MVISTGTYLEKRSSGSVGFQEVFSDRKVQHESHRLSAM